MSERKAFGFTRTECACGECVMNCQHMPSYLIPEDLPAIVYSDNKVVNSTIKL
jgi:hypothetical protein